MYPISRWYPVPDWSAWLAPGSDCSHDRPIAGGWSEVAMSDLTTTVTDQDPQTQTWLRKLKAAYDAGYYRTESALGEQTRIPWLSRSWPETAAEARSGSLPVPWVAWWIDCLVGLVFLGAFLLATALASPGHSSPAGPGPSHSYHRAGGPRAAPIYAPLSRRPSPRVSGP